MVAKRQLSLVDSLRFAPTLQFVLLWTSRQDPSDYLYDDALVSIPHPTFDLHRSRMGSCCARPIRRRGRRECVDCRPAGCNDSVVLCFISNHTVCTVRACRVLRTERNFWLVVWRYDPCFHLLALADLLLVQRLAPPFQASKCC